MYGFHKSRQYNTENYFSHELFKRDQLDPIKFLKQLSEIERKPEKKKKGEDHCQADKTSLYILESMESMDD